MAQPAVARRRGRAGDEAGFGDVAIVTSQDLHDRYFAERGDQLSPVGGEDLVIATVSTA